MTIRTVVETISLDPLPSELAPSLARSASGRLALARAVAALVEQLLGSRLPLDAVLVTKAPSGRPEIRVDEVAFPREAALCRRMRVSISHSRSTALGAASVEESLL
jgi:phosphopantetheinyl transferase (holo-ACP synthase)